MKRKDGYKVIPLTFNRKAVIGSATVLITIGGINMKPVMEGDMMTQKEHLCITASFDHNFAFRNRQPDPIYSFEITIKPHPYRVFKTIDMK